MRTFLLNLHVACFHFVCDCVCIPHSNSTAFNHSIYTFALLCDDLKKNVKCVCIVSHLAADNSSLLCYSGSQKKKKQHANTTVGVMSICVLSVVLIHLFTVSLFVH